MFNQIKTDGIEKLSNELKRYKNLFYLNLSINYLFFEEIDDFVYAIKYMNNLIELNVSNNQISSEGISMIGEILPKTIQKLNHRDFLIFLYINKDKVHDKLYDQEELLKIDFEIKDKKISQYIYLCLLIEDGEMCDYHYSFELINNINDIQRGEKEKIFKK